MSVMLGKRYSFNGKAVAELSEVQRRGIEIFNAKGYPFGEIVACPICGAKEFEPVSEKDRYGMQYNLVICKKCGLLFANPYLREDFLERFYREDTPAIYRKLEEGDLGNMHSYFDTKAQVGKKVYEFVHSVVGDLSSKMVVEIGCSSGGILQPFLENGCRVAGVDYGKQYIQYGRDKGLDLYEGDVHELVKRNIKADIILYADTLEHIPDVTTQLRLMREVLRDDGFVYVGVPSVKNLSAYQGDFLHQLQNAHVFCFTLTTLTNLMRRNGFELVHGTEELRAIYRKAPPNSHIENEYDEIKKYLFDTEKKRNNPIKKTKRLIKFFLRKIR